jgi:hypothetical protein
VIDRKFFITVMLGLKESSIKKGDMHRQFNIVQRRTIPTFKIASMKQLM